MVVTINPYCRVTLEVQGNVVNNTSTVRVTKLELRNPDGTNVGNCWVLGEIRLGGMLAANMILNNTQSCALTFYSGWDGGGVGTWSGYSCRDVEVSHRSDGSMEADDGVCGIAWGWFTSCCLAPPERHPLSFAFAQQLLISV